METASSSSFREAQARVARHLRRLRDAKGIAQERLAYEAGVDRSYLGKIERGIANPSLGVLCRMAHLLEVDVSVLLRRDVPTPTQP